MEKKDKNFIDSQNEETDQLEKNKFSENLFEKKVEPKITSFSRKEKGHRAGWIAYAFFILFFSALISSLFGFLAGRISHSFSLDDFWPKKENMAKQNDGKDANAPLLSDDQLLKEEGLIVSSVEKASDSVVSIIVSKDVPKVSGFFSDPFFNDPFFNPFGFRQQNNPDNNDNNGGDSQTEKREIGGGTGFIVDSSGYIITNRHVVSEDGAEYTVIFNSGEKIQAQVLAVDSYLDIAVLKVDKNGLPALIFGDSDQLKAGQTVIAIGNSLGEFRNTVSKGIISGLKRNIEAGDGFQQSEALEEVIQTDAAINPGNSGGPLLNLYGQVIGVNVAMAQGAENIGFAIPANQIKQIYQTVKETGKIARPYLGVRYVILNKTIQKENNLDYDYGALVVRGEKITDLAVLPNSPADKAGIMENDIILEIDGQKITAESDLASLIRKKKIGDSLNLKVYSKGKEKNITVVLEEGK